MRVTQILRLIGVIAFGLVGTAFADDVTFTASGTFADGASLGGTLIINTGTGVVESNGLDLTVTGGEAGTPGLTFAFLENSFDNQYDASDNFWEIILSSNAGGIEAEGISESVSDSATLELTIPLGSGTTLVGYAGGSLCTDPGTCVNGNVYSDYTLPAPPLQQGTDPVLTSGALAVSGAPEPSSILLLAVPAVWLIRRQRRNA
jgi:hypothetical protein